MIWTKDGYEHTQTYFSTNCKTILVVKKSLFLKRQIAYFARGSGTAREEEKRNVCFRMLNLSFYIGNVAIAAKDFNYVCQ